MVGADGVCRPSPPLSFPAGRTQNPRSHTSEKKQSLEEIPQRRVRPNLWNGTFPSLFYPPRRPLSIRRNLVRSGTPGHDRQRSAVHPGSVSAPRYRLHDPSLHPGTRPLVPVPGRRGRRLHVPLCQQRPSRQATGASGQVPTHGGPGGRRGGNGWRLHLGGLGPGERLLWGSQPPDLHPGPDRDARGPGKRGRNRRRGGDRLSLRGSRRSHLPHVQLARGQALRSGRSRPAGGWRRQPGRQILGDHRTLAGGSGEIPRDGSPTDALGGGTIPWLVSWTNAAGTWMGF